MFTSVQSLDRLGRQGGGGGVHDGRFGRDPLPVFSAGGPCEQFRHGQGCSLFVVVHPAFPLPTTASPTLQYALKDFLERLSWRVTFPHNASFRLLTVARKRFPWTHTKVDVAPHPLVGLLFREERWRSFLVHLVWKVWIIKYKVCKKS